MEKMKTSGNQLFLVFNLYINFQKKKLTVCLSKTKNIYKTDISFNTIIKQINVASAKS